MPAFLTPLHEFNGCHNPDGPGGGRFCSTDGGGGGGAASSPASTAGGGGGGGGGSKLPEAPGRYFLLDKQTVMVPLDDMDTTRARPEGIAKAEPYMRKAYEGTHTKRKPITLRKKPNGRYEVVDGNSTTAIARKHGWTSLPAHLVD